MAALAQADEDAEVGDRAVGDARPALRDDDADADAYFFSLGFLRRRRVGSRAPFSHIFVPSVELLCNLRSAETSRALRGLYELSPT